MLIYLDMCSIHRPLDDKAQVRILIEGEAVLSIVAMCELGQAELISSDALEYEVGRNPNPIRMAYALGVLSHALRIVRLSPEIERRAREFNDAGLKPLDALHLALRMRGPIIYVRATTGFSNVRRPSTWARRRSSPPSN
jgi:hypothetical protein